MKNGPRQKDFNGVIAVLSRLARCSIEAVNQLIPSSQPFEIPAAKINITAG
jgi:hypothetical protein